MKPDSTHSACRTPCGAGVSRGHIIVDGRLSDVGSCLRDRMEEVHGIVELCLTDKYVLQRRAI